MTTAIDHSMEMPGVHTNKDHAGYSETSRATQVSLESCKDLAGHEDLDKCTPQWRVGEQVYIADLKDRQYNFHVGQIVTPLTESCRVGVRLHGALWEEPQKASIDRYCEESESPKTIAVQPKNLRRCRHPRLFPASYTLKDTVDLKELLRVLDVWQRTLGTDLVDRIFSWLRIEPVKDADVSVSGCSSTRKDYPLSAVLDFDDSRWWISSAGSMQKGRGKEHLEFSFGAAPRRISYVGIKIPPMPFGPLSVREFHILSLDADGSWVLATPTVETMDRSEMQEFVFLRAVETTALRIVCVSNAAAGMGTDCVGLFQVRFA
jgi:hypothetical protein